MTTMIDPGVNHAPKGFRRILWHSPGPALDGRPSSPRSAIAPWVWRPSPRAAYVGATITSDLHKEMCDDKGGQDAHDRPRRADGT